MTDSVTKKKERFELVQDYYKCRYSNLFKVYDKKTGRNVVIKKPCVEMPLDDESLAEPARNLVKKEYEALKGLSHPGIPVMLEYLEGRRILVCEDFTANTLFSMRLAGRIQSTPEAVKEVLLNLLEVVKYLHNLEPALICGGIHPQSVLIRDDGQIMLIEFGFLCKSGAQPDEINFRTHGAHRYASPEQLSGRPASPYDDIYSIGATMFYLATGKELDYSRERKGGKVCERITTYNPDFDPGLESVIMTMVSTEPGIRYNSIDEVEADIKKGSSRYIDSVFVDREDMCEIKTERENVETDRRTGRGMFPHLSLKHIVEGLQMEIGPKKSYVRAAPEEVEPGSEFLLKYPSIDLKKVRIDRTLAGFLPKHIAKSVQGVVIEKNEFDEITLAVKDPSQVMIYDHISYISKGRLQPILYRADSQMLDFAFEYVYNTPPGVEQMSWFEFLEKKRFFDIDLKFKRDKSQMEMFDKAALEGPVVEAANRVVKEAISLDASDIHLETFEKETVLRYRIDGVLHIMDTFSPELARNVIKRFKILAQMDIARETVSQGGRVEVEIAGKAYDLRISVIPVIYGESMVMRILDKGSFDYTLEDLGFEPDALQGFQKLLTKPYGMILVSGPTGSGKSTTLYASLKEINRPDRKLLTIEDPVEYQMPGINQVQVNNAPQEEEKRMTFSKALREFLRQDPDVILVGEIRDAETAHISVQAALTGHLLLSTIHTNDSVGIVTRLKDMGVAPYLVGSVLNGGVAQRLVRKICPACKKKVPATSADKQMFEEHSMEIRSLYTGAGCDNCHDYGYKGRTGIYELFAVNQEVSDMISANVNASEIRKYIRARGANDLLGDALIKARKGVISMEEVSRVIAG